MDGDGHAHGLGGNWSGWLRRPGLRVILVGLAVTAVATVVGLVWLWPDGSGRDAAIARADEIGLVSERLDARVESVTDGPCSYSSEANPQRCRTIVVLLSEGPEAGAVADLGEFNLDQPGFSPDVSVGDEIIVGFVPSTNTYFFADIDRRTTLLWLAAFFAVMVVALGRLRGALALASMAITVVVLVAFVAPSVLDGNDPVVVAVVAASAIAFVSLYLTHGFTPTTTVALAGTLAALGLTFVVSAVFFGLADFTGLATEEGLTIPAVAADIDLSALLLAGAVIGALGAIDDVTVTQVATVAELRYRNPGLRTRELVTSGIRVGREHIASTVNTLLLAYVGASLPLLLLFAVTTQSLDVVANSEIIAVEIVRTLCGSIGLVAAVPLTTMLAASLLAGSSPALGGEAGRPELVATEGEPQAVAPSWDDFAPRDDPEW